MFQHFLYLCSSFFSSNINVGSKALSQDSVFTSDPPSPETNEALQSSHDSIHGKVKSLQVLQKPYSYPF